jgi:hypothetical protein
LDFQGFQSILPVWMAVILAILLIILAVISYRDKDTLSLPVRISLISLRSMAFIILIFMLMNPYFKGFEQINEKSRVLLLVDNSNSMDIQKGEYQGAESINALLNDLNLRNSDLATFETWFIGRDISKTSIDSLSFSDSETNLFDAMQLIKDSEFDASSAILITDGIYTIGRDPLFSVSDIGIPVYTVLAGDSSKVTDLVITEVETPPIGYLNVRQPVEVRVRNSGFKNQKSRIQIFKSGKLLDEKEIVFDQEEAIQSISFDILPDLEGLNTLEIRLEELEGEWSSENNIRLLNIDVQNNKLRVLDIAFEIHPDLGAIRNLIKSDQYIELTTKTWISGRRFIESDRFPPPDSLELLIIHGLPEDPVNRRIAEEYIEELPFILFQKPIGSDLQGSRVYQNFRLMQAFSSVSDIGIYPAVENDEHPIMELPDVDYFELNPLLSQYRNIELIPGSRALFNVAYQNLETSQPLIAIRESGDKRQVHVNAFGWYKIAQSNKKEHRDWFKELLNNLISWTSDKPDNRRLKIETTNIAVNTGESIEIRAYLKNESGEVEDDGRIDVEIESPDGQKRSFSMENNGNGIYSLQIPSGKDGLYQFNATARKGNRVIESRSGEFVVSPSNSELVNTIRNESLLRQTASFTGGSFYEFDNASNLLEDMNKAGLFRNEQSQREVYAFWVRNPLWFVLVMILLASEWLIRKFYSLP